MVAWWSTLRSPRSEEDEGVLGFASRRTQQLTVMEFNCRLLDIRFTTTTQFAEDLVPDPNIRSKIRKGRLYLDAFRQANIRTCDWLWMCFVCVTPFYLQVQKSCYLFCPIDGTTLYMSFNEERKRGLIVELRIGHGAEEVIITFKSMVVWLIVPITHDWLPMVAVLTNMRKPLTLRGAVQRYTTNHRCNKRNWSIGVATISRSHYHEQQWPPRGTYSYQHIQPNASLSAADSIGSLKKTVFCRLANEG